MADNDQIPPEIVAESNPPHSSAIDEEDRLRPAFVEKVLDAVDAGDDETARQLVEPLHPADIADLIELAARDERDGLVKDRKSTRLNSSHPSISYAVFCLKKKIPIQRRPRARRRGC